MFSEANVTLLQNIIRQDLLKAIGETLYMTFLPTIIAFAIGLPLGVLLVTGAEGGIHPLPKPLMAAVNAVINLLRSVPFLILLVVVLPLSRFLVGTTVGSKAIIAPLAIAAFPFIARLVETSVREVDQGVIEAAQAMGANVFQVIRFFMIPETLGSVVLALTTGTIGLLGASAMAGYVGGGGVGDLALTYGYEKMNTPLMILTVIILVILVQAIQLLGSVISGKLRAHQS